jgi:hypothetical protein
VSDRRSIRYVALVRTVTVGREGLRREALTGIFEDGHRGSPMGLIERLTAQKVTARAWSTIVRVASAG